MINEKFFLRLPTNFKNKCKIYPPSINEILEDDNFLTYKKILTITQEDLEDEFLEKQDLVNEKIPTPLEFLLASSYHNKDFETIAKQAIKFFIKEDVTFIYDKKSILIGNLEKKIQEIKDLNELIFIKEEEYFDFQNIIRESIGEKKVEDPRPNEDPRIKRMKAKARYRDKIKAKKGLGISLGTILASICCMGIGITPLNIGEMSYPALLAILNTYQEKEKYELDISTLLAGGNSKKIKPKYWIRNLE